MAADATLFGAVGGPKWDGGEPYEGCAPRGPGCCACARTCSSSPICGPRSATRLWPNPPRLKKDVVEGLDNPDVRELTGGVLLRANRKPSR